MKYSLLDLSWIVEGGDASSAFANTRDLACHAENWGYHRYWLAEHHNMPGIASAATAVVIGHVAGSTEFIRVGAGGIMLPNHAPLVIAEQFGTLESLYPGRIDLGLGRAPGTDQVTSFALRRERSGDVDAFPDDVLELQRYFADVQEGQRVQAVPGAGLRVPLWILGSSLYGAQLAAALGLPYVFASHFAPSALHQAIDIYRRNFTPSQQLKCPYVMAGFNVFAADSMEEAKFWKSSSQQSTLNLRMGRAGKLPAPVRDFEAQLGDLEKSILKEAHLYSSTGDRDVIERELMEFAVSTGVDEIILSSAIHDHAARLRSFEIAAGVLAEMSDKCLSH